MPLYMDVHHMDGGVSAEDVAGAHARDVEVQGSHGVDYKHYWVDEKAGKIFCLVDAPSAEAAATVHREAHGLVADEIYEVRAGATYSPPLCAAIFVSRYCTRSNASR